MKLKFLLLFLTVSLAGLYSQTVYDTLTAEKVGPGMTHYYLRNYSVPWAVSILEIDLTNPYLSVETIKGQDNYTGLELNTSMAARNSYEGHKVIGSINGDLWSGGPIGQQVSNGEIVKGTGNHSTIYFSEEKDVFLSMLSFNSSLITKDTAITLSGTNITRGSNNLVLYNKYIGTSAGTSGDGTEVVLTPATGWIINDTVKLVVTEITSPASNTAIPGGKVVLSGSGIFTEILKNKLNVNDTVKLLTTINSGVKKRISQLIGGYPLIVKDGANYALQGMAEEGHPSGTNREPRTGIGFSQDSTKLYFFVVDGRQDGLSAGMLLVELADLMVNSGVYKGMNLDGGGSSSMVIRGEVMNSPSDQQGVERAVSNSLQIISSAPSGVLSSIKLRPYNRKVYKGEALQFVTEGKDQYYNPFVIETANVAYSLSGDFGSIAVGGLFTAGDKADTGFVIASYNGLKDSVKVIVKVITKITTGPKGAVIDTIKTLQFATRAYDFEGIEHAVAASELTWSVSDETIGSIDAAGKFKAKKEGTVKVITAYKGLRDTVEVRVEAGAGRRTIDAFSSLNGLSVSGENLDSVKIAIENIEGKNSLRIDYWYTGDPQKGNNISVLSDIPVYGVPDSLNMYAKSSNTNKNLLTYVLSDENAELFQMIARQHINTDKFIKLPGGLSTVTPVVLGSKLYFPLKIKQMNIQLAGEKLLGAKYSGTIYLQDLYAAYPAGAIGVEDGEYIPERFSLSQNYPNPFNPSTKIRFSIEKAAHVSLRIYDILGREIAVMAEEYMKAGEHQLEWNASSYPSGVYIYRLNVEGRQISKKMALIK
jgi:hypothetical protein